MKEYHDVSESPWVTGEIIWEMGMREIKNSGSGPGRISCAWNKVSPKVDLF
jgi:hypothetical protein